MQTLEQTKVSVTLPRDVSVFLKRRAKNENSTVPKTILAIVVGTMEGDKDEDEYLGRLAEEAEREGGKPVTMEEAWKIVHAL